MQIESPLQKPIQNKLHIVQMILLLVSFLLLFYLCANHKKQRRSCSDSYSPDWRKAFTKSYVNKYLSNLRSMRAEESFRFEFGLVFIVWLWDSLGRPDFLSDKLLRRRFQHFNVSLSNLKICNWGRKPQWGFSTMKHSILENWYDLAIRYGLSH